MNSNYFFKEFYSEILKIFSKKLTLFMGEKDAVYERK